MAEHGGEASADLRAVLERLRREVAALRGGTASRQELDARFNRQDDNLREAIGALEHVRVRVESLEQVVQRLEEFVRPAITSARALPFMAGEPFEAFDAGAPGRVIGFRDNDAGREDRYVAFEDVFRGTEERVRGLLEPYLPLLEGASAVLDLGCGRGELLDLLRDHGIPAGGVDADPAMVARCRAKGHERVEHADAVTYLEGLEAESVDVVFSSQVIEHVPYEALERLLSATLRALRPRGTFIAETVNPHAVDALKGFWLDPTHEHPLFPEVMLVLCRSAGFASGYVFHPGGTGDVEADRFNAAAYAVVATRA